MEEACTSNQETSDLQRKPENQATLINRPREWPAVLTVGALVTAASGGVGAIVWASAAFTDIAVATNFIVVNILSLFVLLAIVAQACIY